jgi:hypothetical protein
MLAIAVLAWAYCFGIGLIGAVLATSFNLLRRLFKTKSVRAAIDKTA